MSLIGAALKPRSILVATDFSEASEKALRYSLALARFYESTFCLAHVVSSVGLTMAGPGAIAACEASASREAADLQDSLIQTGALTGIQHKFIVRQGDFWPELTEIIRQERTDLLVVGTHGRHGLGKLFFGSIAEQIFRQAGCPVLAFGPHSQEYPWVGTSSRDRTFLFATDFGEASLQGLPKAIAVANHFGAKLAFLHIIPAVPPRHSSLHAGDLRNLRDGACTAAFQLLAPLTRDSNLDVTPECHVELESKKPVSEWILETADRLRADLIIMGLHYSAHSGVLSHFNWTTAYDVVCQATTPVLTVNDPSGNLDIRPKPAQITVSPLSQADLIRIRGFGAKW